MRLPVSVVMVVAVGGAVVGARALEIPLKRGTGEVARVGFVDMDRVFREYPETQKARLEYLRALERCRLDLAEKERRLALLDAPAVPPAVAPPVVSTGLFTLPPQVSSPVAAPPPAVSTGMFTLPPEIAPPPPPALTGDALDVEKRKQRDALEADRQAAVKELKDLEERRSVQILGSLYKALVQLAEDRGVGLVVDKSSILYGQDAIDLTDALSRRVRGLPDEVK